MVSGQLDMQIFLVLFFISEFLNDLLAWFLCVWVSANETAHIFYLSKSFLCRSVCVMIFTLKSPSVCQFELFINLQYSHSDTMSVCAYVERFSIIRSSIRFVNLICAAWVRTNSRSNWKLRGGSFNHLVTSDATSYSAWNCASFNNSLNFANIYLIKGQNWFGVDGVMREVKKNYRSLFALV